MTKRIGGYFELELGKRNDLHSNALALNSGRNCLKHILSTSNFSKIYLPYYTCEVLLEPIKKCGLKFEFYHIDKQLNPLIQKTIEPTEAVLYINYFGIKLTSVQELSKAYKNLIIDNSQSLFSEPLDGINTFYSPRKFMGLPDGGFLYTSAPSSIKYEKGTSQELMSHLIKRIEHGAEEGYLHFSKNDAAISQLELKGMSTLTAQLIGNAAIEEIKQKRLNNFSILHEKLKSSNQLEIDLKEIDPPMVYPYLIKDGARLRKMLIENKIFVATYWKGILEYLPKDSYENYLVENLLPLPIDQRIGVNELKYILEFITPPKSYTA